MPAQVESCVSQLLEKWKKDPSSRPRPRKPNQDAKSQAWAICTAAYKKTHGGSLSMMFEEGGYGPTFIGAAATNRPYIPSLKETVVEKGDDDNATFVVHLANAGMFNHPKYGPFVLNKAVFLTMIDNFSGGVLGQKAAYDARHLPDLGALGWFSELFIDKDGKRLFRRVDPTPTGLEKVGGGQFLYSSMEFHRNFKRDDVTLDLEGATELDVCLSIEPDPVEDPEEDNMSEELQQELDTLREELAQKQADLDASEAARLEADERSVQLERRAMNSRIDGLAALAGSHRDSEGNALPKQFVEWIGKVLRFEEFGEDEDVVRLEMEEDESPDLRVVDYLAGAIKHLVLSMPGMVPSRSTVKPGKNETGGDEDDFPYEEEWS